MTILTSKMKTVRDALESQQNCKFWITGDAPGTIITEKMQGLTATDALATHDVPHTISIITSGVMGGSGNIELPRYGVMLSVQLCSTSFALTNVTLGFSSTSIFIGGSGATIVTPEVTQAGAMSGTLVAGQKHCAAISWDETNLYSYEGKDADASLINTAALTALIITAMQSGLIIPNYLALNSGIRSSMYGVVLFGFDAPKTTAEVITAINWMKNRWIAGHYELYQDWK